MLRFPLVVLTICLPFSQGYSQPKKAEVKPETKTGAPSLQEWATKVYRFPAADLATSFVSPERGQLHAPPMPKADATPKDLELFVRQSTDIVNQYLKIQGIFAPKGTLFIFDPANSTLAVRTTYEVHQQIAPLADFNVHRLSTYLDINAEFFEADAAVIRQVVNDAPAQVDHSPLAARLEALADKGEAKRIATLHMPTRSGQRARVLRALDGRKVFSMTVDRKNDVEIEADEGAVETNLEVDPVIGPDGVTIDVNYSLTHHYSPLSERWEPLVPGSPRVIETHLTNYHSAKVDTSITLLSGMTSLCGVWPTENSEPGHAPAWQAAFLKVTAVPLLPILSHRAEDLLKELGEKIEPQPKPLSEKDASTNLPPGMMVRRFRVPPDFMSSSADVASRGTAASPAAADPFSAPARTPKDEPRVTMRVTTVDILKSLGIEFPLGSSANFNAYTSELVVRNTPENLTAVEAFVNQLIQRVPMEMGVRVHLIQADGALIRSLTNASESLADRTPALRALEEAAAANKAKVLGNVWLLTRSGQRAAATFGQTYMYLDPPTLSAGPIATGNASTQKAKDQKPTDKPKAEPVVTSENSLTAAVETRKVGTLFEVDPVLGPDGQTIDLSISLDYDYAPPVQRHPQVAADEKVLRPDMTATDFHRANVTTSVSLLSGATQLIGVWRPEGLPEFQGDILQAAFISVDVMPVESADHKK